MAALLLISFRMNLSNVPKSKSSSSRLRIQSLTCLLTDEGSAGLKAKFYSNTWDITIPTGGYTGMTNTEKLISSICIFFSKPMTQSILDSAIFLFGGSIVQKASYWKSTMRASVIVEQMENIPYILNTVGLIDSAGNLVI